MSRRSLAAICRIAVLACLTAASYYLLNYVLGRVQQRGGLEATASRFPSVRRGVKLDVDGVFFGRACCAMILVTSPNCGFCQASKTFHQALAGALAQRGVPLYVALPYGADGSFLGLPPVNQIEWRNIKGTLRGTPTLILLDRSGFVKGVWEGLLRASTAAEVLAMAHDLT
jgi:hypothetical protein